MKSKIISVLRVIVCMLTVFALIGTFGVIMADRVYTPEYLRSRVMATDTYENACNSLMKRFSDNYSISNIPIEVYESSFTSDWMKNAIDEKINSYFEKREAEIDCSEAEKNITEYFEAYAHDAHVIKDETYEKKLAESITYAQKTALEQADVFSLDVMDRAGISAKASHYMALARKYMMLCIAAAAVLGIVLILLKKPLYWIGTALFAAGMIMTVPTVIIKAEGLINKFSLKDYTTYTLVTGTMDSLAASVMKAGIVMLAVGAVMIALHLIIQNKHTKSEGGEECGSSDTDTLKEHL